MEKLWTTAMIAQSSESDICRYAPTESFSPATLKLSISNTSMCTLSGYTPVTIAFTIFLDSFTSHSSNEHLKNLVGFFDLNPAVLSGNVEWNRVANKELEHFLHFDFLNELSNLVFRHNLQGARPTVDWVADQFIESESVADEMGAVKKINSTVEKPLL